MQMLIREGVRFADTIAQCHCEKRIDRCSSLPSIVLPVINRQSIVRHIQTARRQPCWYHLQGKRR